MLTKWLLQIITQPDKSLTIDLYTEDSVGSTLSKNCGKLMVHGEECISSKTAIEMVFRCSDSEYKDLFQLTTLIIYYILYIFTRYFFSNCIML